MLKLEPVSHYTILVSEKKDLGFNHEKEVLAQLGKLHPGTRFFYFHHQHQANRFFTDQVFTDQSKLSQSKSVSKKIWADAGISNQAQTALSMKVADCFPLALISRKNNIFSLIHAGWKPLLQNIIELTIKDMELKYELNPTDLTAWIGPGIHSCCYRFKQQPLQAQLPSWKSSISKMGKTWIINLPNFIKQELERLGLKSKQILDYNACTYCQDQDFFSHRRYLDSSTDGSDPEGRHLIALISNDLSV